MTLKQKNKYGVLLDFMIYLKATIVNRMWYKRNKVEL